MSKVKTLTLVTTLGAVMAALIVFAGPASANHPGGHPVTICHKPGTPAQQTMTIPQAAVGGHLGHGDTLGQCGAPPPPTGCAAAVSDTCIDGDGVLSPTDGGAASFETNIGDPLTSFPVTGTGPFSGLDAFDNDNDGNFSPGDDLHVEDPGAVDTAGNPVCPTAIRDAVHQFGMDCRVLDVDGSLATNPTVDCDVEVQIEFVLGACDPLFKYHDTNVNGIWNSGEDLIRDNNNNGVFD